MSEVKENNSVQLVHSGMLSGFKTLSDGTIKIEISLSEIDPEQSVKIFKLHNKFIKFLLSNKNITQQSADIVNSLELDSNTESKSKNKKSPQQILRNRMFVYYKHKYGKSDGFQSWYEGKIDVLGMRYLEEKNNLEMQGDQV